MIKDYIDWQISIIFEKIYVYVLLIDDNFYYVGSSINLSKRLKHHRNRKGSMFTKNYKTLKLIEAYIIPNIMFYEAEIYESFLALKYVKKYGYKNANGGCFAGLTNGAFDALNSKYFCCHKVSYHIDDTSYLDNLTQFKHHDNYDFIENNNSPQLKLL